MRTQQELLDFIGLIVGDRVKDNYGNVYEVAKEYGDSAEEYHIFFSKMTGEGSQHYSLGEGIDFLIGGRFKKIEDNTRVYSVVSIYEGDETFASVAYNEASARETFNQLSKYVSKGNSLELREAANTKELYKNNYRVIEEVRK